MTGPAELLAICHARGIRLLPTSDGSLTIDAPRDALTPDLVGWQKAEKGELLAVPDSKYESDSVDLANATAVWHAALDLLQGDPLFPSDVMEALRNAEVRWATEDSPDVTHGRPKGTDGAEQQLAEPICRCGSTTTVDVPIHSGKSVRRDCGRFVDFPVWYGKGTLRNE
jgi:hypothetical protein